MKILISAKKKDSINSVSKRINLSYGWTYYWTQKLIDIGIFQRKGKQIILEEKNKFYKKFLSFIREIFKNDISFYYSVLELFGIKYCFTKTDAVFIWTRGGYNISRYRDYYPVFIKIRKKDFNVFREYCKKLGLRIRGNKGVFYSVEILEDFDVFYYKDTPVDSLEETIYFMKKNIYNFQPALEMIQELYDKKLGIKYKEIK